MEKQNFSAPTSPNIAKTEETPVKTVVQSEEKQILTLAKDILLAHKKAFLELAK